MSKLEELFLHVSTTASDINQHMETLKKYAEQSEHVTELGVRAISTTYAFMAGNPKTIRSYDLAHPSYYGGNLDEANQVAEENNIDFKFIEGDALKVEIEETDLLFIDTFHAYDQLKQELELHSPKVKKFIIMHDTVSFGSHDEPLTSLNSIQKMTTGCGLIPAIDQFLEVNPEWSRLEVFENNNGLTVLVRSDEELIPVVVTKQILEDNPELVGEVKEGETIGVPLNDNSEEETTKETETPKVEEVVEEDEPVTEETPKPKRGRQKNA